MIDALRKCNLVIESVHPVRQSLEDFFIEAVSGSEGGRSVAPPASKGGPVMTQTAAIFHDAYRSLNAKKMFWIVLVLSGLVVAAFACVGINKQGFNIGFWHFDSSYFNGQNFEPRCSTSSSSPSMASASGWPGSPRSWR